MKRWLAGYLMCIAAGITMLISAVVPWVNIENAYVYYAWQLHLYGTLASMVLIGSALIAFGFMRTMWASMVALVAAFASGIMVLAIHANAYVGLRQVAPFLALGEVTHVTGYGVGALFAAGMLAGAAGFVTLVQAAPPVETRPRTTPQSPS